MANEQYTFSTDSLTQFRGTLAQNAGVDLDLEMSGAATVPNPTALAGVHGDCRGNLKSLTVVSVENLAWELLLWEKSSHGTAVLGTVRFIGRWTFTATDAVRIAGAGDYFYYIDGLDVPLVDGDGTGKLHLTLVNRSAAGKSAGDAGAIQIRGRIAPLQA